MLFLVNATKPSSLLFALRTISDRDSVKILFCDRISPVLENTTYFPSSKRMNNFSVDVHPITSTRVYCQSFPGICAIYA